jgi:hypothetical protein
MAESDVVISRTDAPSNLGSESARGVPLPMNKAARRAAARFRAAINAIGTPEFARRRPIVCPIRPGPIIAMHEIGLNLRKFFSKVKILLLPPLSVVPISTSYFSRLRLLTLKR